MPRDAFLCAPWPKDNLVRRLKRVAQRKLNQPWRTHGRKDSPKRSRVLHIIDRGIREVCVIPDVEEVRRKAQGLLLRQLEILDEGEVPILLVRAAVDVPAEIAEESYCAIASSRCRHGRSRCEVRGVQVTVIHAIVNTPACEASGKGTAWGELAPKSERSKAGPKKRCPRCGIRHRERRSRLEDGDAAQSPAAERCSFPSGFIFVKRQIVAVTDHEPVLAVEVRETAGSSEARFVVKGSVERGVSAGSGVR